MRSLVRRGPWMQWRAAFRDSPPLWAVAPAALLGWAVLAQMAVMAPLHHSGFGAAAVHALAMAAAMALPATNDPLRHVLRSSFADRAARHCTLFLVAFAASWVTFGLLAALAVAAFAAIAPGLGMPIAAAALLAAAAWQTRPARRRALGRCHGTLPIYAEGAAGMRSAAAYGWRIGGACVAACGPLMLAAMLSPLPLPAMAAAAALAARERYGRPGAAAHHARLFAAAAALLLLGFGLGLD